MLLEAAIGDAFGAGREFAPADFVVQTNDGISYAQNPKWPNLVPGKYTDDTQMTIGLAEFMLSGKAPTNINLWTCFLQAYKRDPRPGYAGKFYEILKAVNNVDELVRRIQPQSDKSGGAMRASPCGLLPTVTEAIDYAIWQASLTHASRDGLAAAAGAAALTWACRHGCDRGYLPQFLDDVYPGFAWSTPWTDRILAPGLHPIKAALASIVNHDNLTDILKATVAFTGDVDTAACIALAAASLHPTIQNNLAQPLYDKLEPTGKYGLPFLMELDAKLLAKFPLIKAPTATPPPELSPSKDNPQAVRDALVAVRKAIDAAPDPSTERGALFDRWAELRKICPHTNPDGSSAWKGYFGYSQCDLCGLDDL